jgi:hypothetical protein
LWRKREADDTLLLGRDCPEGLRRNMKRFPRPAIVAASLLCLAMLSACGDQEPDQRKAFITFLQTRIIDKPGIHVPILTNEERASLGPYADQYAIISNFHKVMNESVSPKFVDAMTKGSIHSIADVVTHRADIELARTALGQMSGALGADRAQADEAHGKLNQPADLKPVFDKAYDRLVTNVAKTFNDVVPVADRVLGEALDFATYLDQHKDRIKLNGPIAQVTDPRLETEVNDQVKKLQGDQRAIADAQQKLRAVIYGP